MPDKAPNFPIYVFAKAPVAGTVKTRLCPPLTPAQAAEVATWLLESTVKKLVAHWPGRVVLCVAPDASHPIFQRLIAELGVETEPQISGDLGARMQYALEQGVAQSGGAAVIGCDVPDLSSADIQAAWSALAAGENAIAPTEDGGFFLLACRAFVPTWFAEVNWGTETVYSQLMDNARAAGSYFKTLDMRGDLDVVADLERAAKTYPALKAVISNAG